MTMTRILQCVLVLIVLTTAGCSLWEGSGSTNSTNKNANVASNTNADQSTSAQTTPTINARPDNVRGQNQQPHEDVSSTRAQPRGSGSANQNTTDENQNTTSP